MTNSLQAALDAANVSEKTKKTPKPKQTPKSKKVIGSNNRTPENRKDTVLIAGHFSKDILKQLKFIGIEEEKTNQELLGEALNLLFVKKGKKSIF